MHLKELIQKNRSYRRFDGKYKISEKALLDLIELARFSACGRNAQSLKYIICNNQEVNDQIFTCLSWAGYLTGWPGPEYGERPTAYIIVLHDQSISEKYYCDDGIAMQNILLGAVEKELGGCILRAFNRSRMMEILNLPDQYEIIDVVALGKPAETVVVDPLPENGDTRYWRDKHGVHHVPKRSVEELVIAKLV